jgi:hypothetical protein
MEPLEILKQAMAEAQQELQRREFQLNDAETRLQISRSQVEEARAAAEAACQAYITALERDTSRTRPSGTEHQLRQVAVGKEFEDLVYRAGSRNTEEQLVAMAELKQMGAAGIESLLSLLGSYERRRQKRWGFVGISAVAVTSVAVLQILLNWPLEVFNIAMLVGCMSAGLITRPLGRHRRALQVLSKLDDARLAPVFMDVLISSDLETRRIAMQGLERLLPRVMASDAYLFNPSKRAQLGQILRDAHTSRLALGVLSAIEQIDAREALEDVAAVVQGRTLHREMPEVVRTASAVQHALVERTATARAGGTLLRASEAPGNDTLVRPVSTADTDAAQLLRPVVE